MAPRPRPEGPIVVLVLSVCATVWFATSALRLHSIPAWPDQSSDPFELRVGVEGDWRTYWEPRSGEDRMRVLWLDAPPWDGESSSLGADIRITVEPREAVVSAIGSGSPREEEGQITSWGSGRTPILIDPPLVRRIHYRVERVDSKYEGTTTRLFVRGAPDSEHPELAPVFASVAVLFGVFGIVPSIVWLRSVRRNGPPASLEESIFTEK